MILKQYIPPAAEPTVFNSGVPLAQSIGNARVSGVYKIKCTATNKVYIGSAIWIAKRKRYHLQDLRRNTHRNPHLQKAWNKYGEDAFEFYIIELCSVDQLVDREQYYIEDSRCFDHRFGYNIQRVAYSAIGTVHSDETKAKLSKLRTGRSSITPEWRTELSTRMRGNTHALGLKHTLETIKKLKEIRQGRKPALGMTHSQESRQKMSDSKKGRPLSEKNKAGISAALRGRSRTFSIEQCEEIKNLHREGLSICKISDRFQRSRTSVSNVVNRKVLGR